MSWITALITAIAPIAIALIGIIPTILSNGKKTRESVENTTKETGERIERLQNTLDTHIREDEDDTARNRRYRILRFYDEICEHRKHSESHFEDILDDIDAYEKYCNAHPDFHNNRGRIAMEQIKAAYTKVKTEGGFLHHNTEEEKNHAE